MKTTRTSTRTASLMTTARTRAMTRTTSLLTQTTAGRRTSKACRERLRPSWRGGSRWKHAPPLAEGSTDQNAVFADVILYKPGPSALILNHTCVVFHIKGSAAFCREAFNVKNICQYSAKKKRVWTHDFCFLFPVSFALWYSWWWIRHVLVLFHIKSLKVFPLQTFNVEITSGSLCE